ncbi:hypothetical protein [Enterococcus malodoratus]|uniref:hypothetical protein n=1 Tax=Enterococcus malodoratus TaxID=71451 RepID=UPI0039B0BCDC
MKIENMLQTPWYQWLERFLNTCDYVVYSKRKSGEDMNLYEKCCYLNVEALDRGFTMEKQFIGNIARISFSDEGKVGMDMEISDTDIVVPFARLTQYADESFAEFALEVLGTDFKKGAINQ